MKVEQATANVELSHGEIVIKLKALVDTGVSKSVISKRLADRLKAFALDSLLHGPFNFTTTFTSSTQAI